MNAPSLTQIADEELMLLVANGVIQEPATELFRRHNRALFNFIAWMCQGNTHEAEDIAQRTWMKILSACASYQPSARFRTFLFQIAHNAVLDGRRSHAQALRETLDDIPELPSEDLSPEAEWHLKRNIGEVRQALLQLPALQREAIVLRYFNEMSLDEIAQTTGDGVETIKSRLRYAYAKLRQALEALA